MSAIVERLRRDARNPVRAEPQASKNLMEAADEIERLQRRLALAVLLSDERDVRALKAAGEKAEIERLEIENWQLKGALGYEVPGHIPCGDFKCGLCEAKTTSLLATEADNAKLRAALQTANDALAKYCSHQLSHQETFTVLGAAWKEARRALEEGK